MTLKIIFSLLCFGILVLVVPVDKTLEVAAQVETVNLAVALILIMTSVGLSSFRFKRLISTVDPNISLGNVHRINILSQVVGLFALNAVGQITFRSIYGGKYTKYPQRLVFLSLIEKLVAMLTLALLAILGAVTITRMAFGHDVHVLSQVITGIAVVLAVSASYVWILKAGQKRYLRRIIRHVMRLKTGDAAVLSVLMHLLMLAAYVVLAKDFIENVSVLQLSGIFSIVMLGAAIPISFAGWGLRELSSSFVFAWLGLNAEIGLFVALVIGGLSIVALLLHALVVTFVKDRKIKVGQDELDAGRATNLHFEKAIAFLGLLFLPILVGMQMRLPTESSAVTVNLADPIAIGLGISFIAIFIKNYLHQSCWRVRGFTMSLIFFVALICLGWLSGFISVGYSHWATYNRLLGLLVLLAYLFSGAAIVLFLGRESVRAVVKVFMASTLVILLLTLVCRPYLDANVARDLNWLYAQFNGLMQNRNALAFALCVFLCLDLAFQSKNGRGGHGLITGILLGLIVVTLSRTAFVCAIVTVLVAVWFRYVSFRRLVQAIGVAAVFVGATFVVWKSPIWAPVIGEAFQTVFQDVTGQPTSNKAWISSSLKVEQLSVIHVDRLASYELGFKMWLENPIFGAGLGAFITTYNEGFQVPLTIHNTALWILAEMGIVGFVMFLTLPLVVVMHLKNKLKEGLQPTDFALMLIFVNFLLFSMAHEILYQRVFWFAAGLLCVNRFPILDSFSSRLHVTALRTKASQ